MKTRNLENTLAIFKREFLSYFNSPVLYVIVVIYLLASMGFAFFFGGLLARGDASLESFFVFQPWIFVVFVPAVGMRLWSEEHRLGTFELLMTFPVSPWQAILGKFAAGALIWAISLGLTFSVVFTMSWLGNPDPGPIISGYVGAYLYALGCLGITCAASSYTRSQVVCFIVSVFLCVLLTLIGWPQVADWMVKISPTWMESSVKFVQYTSFFGHFLELQKGVLAIQDVLYFLSVIAISLFVTDMGLRSKRG
ncbi:MAG TPA: ABC transporter permease [Prosthecobacter sp.]